MYGRAAAAAAADKQSTMQGILSDSRPLNVSFWCGISAPVGNGLGSGRAAVIKAPRLLDMKILKRPLRKDRMKKNSRTPTNMLLEAF